MKHLLSLLFLLILFSCKNQEEKTLAQQTDNETLISIDQMKINYCIYDLIDIFQNHDELYESLPLLEYYLKEVKLLKEEKILMQCILSIVPQVQLNLQEEVNIYQMSKLICYLDGLQEIFKKLMIDEK